MAVKPRGRTLAELDRGIARDIGARIRAARLEAGLTQARLAEGRYTKAYISALETGQSKPSVAALSFIAERLGRPVGHFLGGEAPAWSRIQADLALASGDWVLAADAYRALLDTEDHPRRKAELQRGLAEALCRLERPEEALGLAGAAAAAFDAVGAPEDAAQARYWLGAAFYQRDNEVEAASIFRSLLDRVRGGLRLEPDWEARLLIALASVDGRSGEEARALGYLEEARALLGDIDDRRRGTFLNALAVSYRERGDLEAAIRLANQALARYREALLDREVALLENELALTYMGMGSLERAREHAAAAEAGMRSVADRRGLAHIVETQAQISASAGDLPQAESLAASALRLARETSNHKAETSAALMLARISRQAGDVPGAIERFAAAATIARAHARTPQLRVVLAEWADVLAASGDDKGAYRLSREALELSRA